MARLARLATLGCYLVAASLTLLVGLCVAAAAASGATVP